MAKLQNKICPGCNKVFKTKNATTCSSRCRMRLHRAKRTISYETQALRKVKQALTREANALKESAEHTLKSTEETFKSFESAVSKEISPDVATEGGFIAGDPEAATAAATPTTDNSVSTAPSQQPSEPFPQGTIIQPVQTVDKPRPQAVTGNMPSEFVSLNKAPVEPSVPTSTTNIEQDLDTPTTVSNEVPSPPLNPPPTQPQPFQEEIPKRPSFGFNLRRWAVLVTTVVLLGGGSLVVLLQPKDQNNPQTQISINAQSLSSIANAPLEAQSNAGTLNINRDSVIALGKSLTTTGQVTFKNSSDSTEAFKVQDAKGDDLILVNTTDGTVTIVGLQGSGANLTDINATNIASGTISDAYLSNNVALLNGDQTFSGVNTFNNSSNSFTGDGSGLANVDAITLQGNNAAYYTNASNISSGTLSDARLSANVTLQGNTFNGANQLVQLDGLGFLPVLNGSALTNLNASNISSGTLDDARLSTNVTLQGNTFNGAGQLVQLTVSGVLPVLSGVNLTDLDASNISQGTLVDARLSSNVALKNADNTFTGTNIFQGTSLTAFQIQNANATSNILVADTSNVRVAIGQASASYTLDVAGDINTSGSLRIDGSVICNELGCLSSGGGGDYIEDATTLQTGNFYIQSAAAASIGAIIQGDVAQSADLQQWRASDNTPLSIVDASGNFGIGTADLGGYQLNVNGTANATALRQSGNAVCDTSGNCIGGGGGMIGGSGTTGTLAVFTDAGVTIGNSNLSQVGTTTTATGTFNATTALQTNGTNRIDATGNLVNIGSITGTGDLIVKPGVDSLTAFQIQNATGAGNLFIADTTNSRIAIGKTAPDYTLDVAGDINTSGVFRINGIAICTTGGCTPESGSSDYIQLQASSPGSAQTGNFNISGTGIAGTLQAGLLDTASAAILNIGTTNASSISLNQDTSVAGVHTFGTGTGAVSLNGDTTIAAGKTLNAYGSSLFKNSVDSTTAFQVQNANGDQLFNIDTSGSNITLNGLNSGELGAWSTNTNSLPTGRYFASSVIANGYAYVIGGAGASTVYYAKLNADGSTGTWSTNANALPAVRRGPTSVVANGYVYVLGGYSTTYESTVYYAKLNADGSTGTWSTSANALPDIRGYHSSVVANGYVYVVGGYNGSAQSTVYYAKLNADGSTGAWNTNANALPATRYYHSSIVANGYVYVIGGSNGGTVYYAKLNADGSTGAWSTNANALPGGRSYHSSVVANGYMYVIGGNNGTDNQSTVYYAKLNNDGSTGTWSTNANALPEAMGRHSTVIANGYIYVLGGYTTATQPTVYYASTSRILMAGSLDLVGLSGQNLSEDGDFSQGSMGGSLVAGNTSIIGSFNVQGQAAFSQGMSIDKELRVGGSALFKNTTDSTTAFQIQDAAGTSNLFIADTTNGRIGIGTDTPQTQLHIFAASTGEVNLITLETTPNDYDQGAGILFKDDGYNSAQIHSIGYDYGVAGLAFNVTPTPGALTEGMRLDSDGNLGIGTASPGVNLEVVQSENIAAHNVARTIERLQLYDNSGNSWNGMSPGLAFSVKAADVNADIAAIFGVQYNNTSSGSLTFQTASSGVLSEQARISSGGATLFKNSSDSATAFQIQNAAGTSNLFVADTTNSRIGIGTANPQAPLQVSGNLQVRRTTLTEGFLSLLPGDATHAGYISWYKPGSPVLRMGYMGYDATNINLNLENGSKFIVSGGSLQINGDGTGYATVGTSGCGGNFTGLSLNGAAMSGCTNYNLLASPSLNDLYINRTTGGIMHFRENNVSQLTIASGGSVTIANSDLAHPILNLESTANNDRNYIAFVRSGYGTIGYVYDGSGYMIYGTFTGAHMAKAPEGTQMGELVNITGISGHVASEPIYTVEKTTTANNQSVLGSYAGRRLASQPWSNQNTDNISAAGNGEMWVVDNGTNVSIGDNLMSSDTSGHAMKDPKTYPISHVVAKATEEVNWDSVNDYKDGKKHVKISVIYTQFDYSPGNGTNLQGGDPVFDSMVISGELKVNKLIVSGGAEFEGNITIAGNVAIQGTLTLGTHIVTDGEAPEATEGENAGTGAIAAIDGNDQSGTITIQTGASGQSAGQLARIQFHAPYGKAPQVSLTSANGNAAALQYYYNSDTQSFEIKTNTVPLPNTIYKYTYLIMQ